MMLYVYIYKVYMFSQVDTSKQNIEHMFKQKFGDVQKFADVRRD